MGMALMGYGKMPADCQDVERSSYCTGSLFWDVLFFFKSIGYSCPP